MRNSDVCDPSVPRDEKLLAEAKAHVLASVAKGPAADGPLTLQVLLSELDLDLLVDRLSSVSLTEASAEIGASRTAFLARLKSMGVDRLADRQAIVNGVAKAKRAGRVPSAAKP